MKRNLRVLLAWFDERDAVSALLDFHMPEPGASIAAERSIHQRQVDALRGRAPYTEGIVPVEPLPEDIRPRAETVLQTAVAAANPDARLRYSVVMIDLTRLISVQRAVTLEGDEERFRSLDDGGADALLALCLPQERVDEDLSGTFDRDGKGLTITSPNPNLRVGAVQTVEMPGANGVKLIGFPVVFGAPYVHVVEYKGRYFLKDGYHRCYGLLDRGVTHAPVLLQRGISFADVHAGGTTLIAPEHLLGDRPPMVTDFHDPSVSTTVRQQAFRKVVRVRAEDFVINL